MTRLEFQIKITFNKLCLSGSKQNYFKAKVIN